MVICFQFLVYIILHITTNTALIWSQISNPDEVEKILDFHPDRLGHCTCVHPLHGGSQELWNKLLNSGIPVGKYKVLWKHDITKITE
jgi:hypothetical protein